MGFVPFSSAHWAAIVLTAVLAVGIVLFRTKLREQSSDRAARLVLAALLLASEFSLYIWYEVTDNWGYHALPFQLCSMMIWISAAALLLRSSRLYEIAFFLGVLGALQALLTPNLDYTFPYFRYFHFFIAHAAIIGAGVYVTAVASFRPGFGAAFRAWGWLNVLALVAAVVNWLTGQNFMFLAHKPETASLLDLLAPWPWYILQLEIVALAMILLLLGIVRGMDKLFGNRNRTGDR